MKYRRKAVTVDAILVQADLLPPLPGVQPAPYYLAAYEDGRQELIAAPAFEQDFAPIGRSAKTGRADSKPKKTRKPRERNALGSSPLVQPNHEDAGREAEA